MSLEIDNHTLMFHPKRVYEWQEKNDCFPIYVEISPTDRCNYRCIFCAYDFIERNIADIDRVTMLKTLKDMAENGVKAVMFSGEGEPLLHKDICEFVEKAKEYGMDVSLTTAGVLFDREKADRCMPHLSWIRFSVNASSPEVYSKIHRVGRDNFNKVIENIKYGVELKKKNNLSITIGMQFLLISDNAQEVIKITEIAEKIGVNNIQIKPYSHHPYGINKLVTDYSKYAYLQERLEKFNTSEFKVFFRKQTMKRAESGINYKECYGLSFMSTIDSKGNMFPCYLFLEKPDYILGNLYTSSFSNIWKSQQRKQVLKKIMEKGIENCRKICRADVFNRYLHRLKNPAPHDNFI